MGITQFLRKRDEELGHYGTVDDEKPCTFHDIFDIIDSTFQNSYIVMQVEAQGVLNTPPYTSCTQINLNRVAFKEMEQSDTRLCITKAYNVILTNVTIPGLSIYSVHKLTFWNIKMIKSESETAVNLVGINTVKFIGDFIFKYNHGKRGIVLRQVQLPTVQ